MLFASRLCLQESRCPPDEAFSFRSAVAPCSRDGTGEWIGGENVHPINR